MAEHRDTLFSQRELIVVFETDHSMAHAAELATEPITGEGELQSFVVAEGLRFESLARMAKEPLPDDAGVSMPDISTVAAAEPSERTGVERYFKLEATSGRLGEERLGVLAEKLRHLPGVAGAYVKPPVEPAASPPDPDAEVGWIPKGTNTGPAAPSGSTPDFSRLQRYLDPSPDGVDARYAWTVLGGRGENIRVIDVEGDWQTSHESLQPPRIGFVHGYPRADWRNHGTAVLGEIIGHGDGLGVTGIAPAAVCHVSSIFTNASGTSNSPTAAISAAARNLSPGDILVIELHRPGPRYGYQSRSDQAGYIPIEWWPDEFDAIKTAADKGIIVVAAAGNGREPLDDAMFDTPDKGFPGDWANAFRRGNRDSGAILVGAGAPPPGTNGANHGPARSRLAFSNYGSVVDAQGWGREVVTTGYGDLLGGPDEDRWYTKSFAGTSSATPIVAGVLACLQGIQRATNRTLLTPQRARDLLVRNGAPQQDAPGRPATQRIGNLPDLRQLIAEISASA